MPQPCQQLPVEDPQQFGAPGLHPRQRAWVEVDETAIEHNARALGRWLAPGSSLMAVVKADGYGHGAAPVARAAMAGGATSLGVATLQEGIELRQAGLKEPVLVMGNLIHPDELRSCLEWELMPTISGMREALLCQNLASGSGRSMALHLKLDTGMARLGVDWSDGVRLLQAIHGLEAVQLAGVYSHLADADSPDPGGGGLTAIQQQRFERVLSGAAELGLPTGVRHLANSAGTLRCRRLHYDLVRVGLALYGQAPAEHLSHTVSLQPAMSVRARVCLIREVPAGVGVSYGHRYRTRRPTRLAVVTIGYADGVPRLLSNQLEVLFAGRRLAQVGAITMDQLLIDATEAPQLEVGSVVTLLGDEGGERIAPQDWAQATGTIPWEIVCGFKHRLPRLHLGEAERDR
ncbi:alanine racemase [Synechococcus sp. Cruz-9H2]|uniref:alanine racemase n=1 Tax=unclassified Synechococcus TaxID=2626047 RepID=UPI0020CEFCB0|nr:MULTISPECIES: alanine racemase [unclassified Synechococcus]MCP9818971.1 alanine racemase [Synechococcus sp. Cruz-9H2]MCP9843475.1 alanine racemase [Synechococcus sp. Edmonson 11F2]MCP9855143.1 alanine racemase [Synechococcus sp. Cruz-9C9]MCP9862885.1 alanine racemase [Synechococcus sp. Cruz-7E5]MCP9869881.1 alanine racemase [Synechococcus sp. Cruz-7B9]